MSEVINHNQDERVTRAELLALLDSTTKTAKRIDALEARVPEHPIWCDQDEIDGMHSDWLMHAGQPARLRFHLGNDRQAVVRIVQYDEIASDGHREVNGPEVMVRLLNREGAEDGVIDLYLSHRETSTLIDALSGARRDLAALNAKAGDPNLTLGWMPEVSS